MPLLNLLRTLWSRRSLRRRLDVEMQFHLEMETAENIRRGMDPESALRAARRSFGNATLVAEDVHHLTTIQIAEDILRNIRHALRDFRRHPAFSLGAILVLSLAIGANVAVFSVIDSVLFNSLPYPDSGRIVSIETQMARTGTTTQDVSGLDFLDWQARSDAFTAMAAYHGADDFAVHFAGRAMFANPRYVSTDFFNVLGQTPSAGRLLTPADIPQGESNPSVVILAHHWAITHFGSPAAALGQSIDVYGNRLRIVGVTAPGFRYPATTDLWIPWSVVNGASRQQLNYHAIARLKPGVDLAAAQAQLRTISSPQPENRLRSVMVIPLHQRLTGSHRQTLWLIFAAVSFVWWIGCANIANLLLARATDRAREIALRAAIGAGRGRVIMQLLTENFVLAVTASLLGLLMAFGLMEALQLWAPAGLPRLGEMRMDSSALAFTLLLAFGSTLFFGFAPALECSRLDLAETLKQGGLKATASASHSRFRSGLLVGEVALSVVLLVLAALLLQSYQAQQQIHLGFATDRVLIAKTEYVVDGGNSRELQSRSNFYSTLMEQLHRTPGVVSAAGVAYLPMGREPRASRPFEVEDQASVGVNAELHAITPNYFATLQIPFRNGRDFQPTDTLQTPLVAIVNATLARAAFASASPIGRRIRPNPRAPWMEIIGVVADTRWQSPTQAPPPVVYVASTQGWGKSLSILARTSADPLLLASTLRTIIQQSNPAVPVRIETMQELVDATLAFPRFRASLVGMFALIAASLAAVGIFSVVAYLIGQRTRELAIRFVLGASSSDVLRLIMAQGFRLVITGLLLGLLASRFIAGWLQSILFEVHPSQPAAYLSAAAILSSAALLAILLPAWRATRIPLTRILRQD